MNSLFLKRKYEIVQAGVTITVGFPEKHIWQNLVTIILKGYSTDHKELPILEGSASCVVAEHLFEFPGIRRPGDG